MCIVVIGGFGGSQHYMANFIKYLQYKTLRPVLNCSLLHGAAFEIEVTNIIIKIHKTNYKKPFVIIGFSTGCVVALEVSKTIKTEYLILCNPAELLTRFPYECISAILQGNDTPRHIEKYQPTIRKSKMGQPVWNFCLRLFCILWTTILYFIGSRKMAEIYYRCLGKYVNEPRPAELTRVVFSRKIGDLFVTINECLLQQNINDLVRECKSTIHVVVGEKDSYLHVSNHIANNFPNKNIRFKKMKGDHHTLHNNPKYAATEISEIILKNITSNWL